MEEMPNLYLGLPSWNSRWPLWNLNFLVILINQHDKFVL